MKKVLFTAMAAVAMFALVSCNQKKAEEPVAAEEPATVEQCEHRCAHEGATVEQCEHRCAHEGDSARCCKRMEAGDTMQHCCHGAE